MSKITDKKLQSLEKKAETAENKLQIVFGKVQDAEGNLYSALDDFECTAEVADKDVKAIEKALAKFTKVLPTLTAALAKAKDADKAYAEASDQFDEERLSEEVEQ